MNSPPGLELATCNVTRIDLCQNPKPPSYILSPELLLWFTELKFTMCILNLFSADGWPGWYSVNNISSWLENFSFFFYISASPIIHGKLLCIHHHRPKGQLIETMALIHEGKFITRLMGEPLGNTTLYSTKPVLCISIPSFCIFSSQ